MKGLRILPLALAAIISASVLTSTASAQCGWGSQYRGYLHDQLFLSRGYGAGGMLYSLGYVPVPPYYALHPPVYYSYPVPRSYGYSPFAYPGYVRTPEIERPAPQTILNPYVEPKTETEDLSNETAHAPLTILNPFVEQPVATSEPRLARIIQ